MLRNPRPKFYALLFIYNATFAAGVLVLARGTWQAHAWSQSFTIVLMAATAIQFLRVGLRMRGRATAYTWVLFGIAVLLITTGMLLWSLNDIAHGQLGPIPPLATVVFFSSIPFLVVAIALIRAGNPSISKWLLVNELGISLSIVVLINGSLLYEPIKTFTGSPLTLLTALELVIPQSVALLLATFSLSSRWPPLRPRVLYLLFSAMAVITSIAAIRGYTLLAAAPDMGRWFEVLRTIGYSLALAAAVEQNADAKLGVETERARLTGHARLAAWSVIAMFLFAWLLAFPVSLPGQTRFLLFAAFCSLFFLVVRWERLLRAEQAEARALEKALHSFDDFLWVATHELRTPLTPLKLQMAVFRNYPPEQSLGLFKEALPATKRQLTRMVRLVQTIANVTDIQAGRFSLQSQEADLSETVRSAIEPIRQEVVAGGGSIEVDIEPDLYGCFDPERIATLAFGIVDNAAKFGEGKPVLVHLWRQGDWAHVKVVDKGPGIPAPILEENSRPFVRGVPATSYGGFGVGLFVARNVAKAHGGSLQITTSPTSGTTVAVAFPYKGTGKYAAHTHA